MPAGFIEDEDMPNLRERQHFAALARVQSQERECAVLRRQAVRASEAWQSAGDERYPAPHGPASSRYAIHPELYAA